MNGKDMIVYTGILRHRNWALPIGATESGLCCIGADGESLQDMMDREGGRFAGAKWTEDDEKLEPYKETLKRYLDGDGEALQNLKCDMRGTAFQLEVWDSLLAIPFGTTVTYSDIAGAIGKPKAMRAVGSAIGANPLMIVVPCHRVVGKNGALTGYRGGLAMKQKLLELEHAR